MSRKQGGVTKSRETDALNAKDGGSKLVAMRHCDYKADSVISVMKQNLRVSDAFYSKTNVSTHQHHRLERKIKGTRHTRRAR
jgi:hypothetical protein